jgi:hypothetical protein
VANKDENSDKIYAGGPAYRRDVLRAKDIIPSRQSDAAVKTEGKAAAIPKFDLAEDIMAQQRKVAAMKRKAPSPRIETEEEKPRIESADHGIKRPVPELPERDKIIAEIVARDIEKLCRGEYLTR